MSHFRLHKNSHTHPKQSKFPKIKAFSIAIVLKSNQSYLLSQLFNLTGSYFACTILKKSPVETSRRDDKFHPIPT